jgi:hypothetical protein
VTSPRPLQATTCANVLAPSSPHPRPRRSHLTSPLAPALESGARAGHDQHLGADRRSILDTVSPAPAAFPMAATVAPSRKRSGVLTCRNAVPFYPASTHSEARTATLGGPCG